MYITKITLIILYYTLQKNASKKRCFYNISLTILGLLLIIHMMRADIQTEVSPIVGTEKQSEELVHYLLEEFENDPKKIWESNIFGKSLYELVNEGLHNKLSRMPDTSRLKMRDTLERIINEGSGGLICIIL